MAPAQEEPSDHPNHDGEQTDDQDGQSGKENQGFGVVVELVHGVAFHVGEALVVGSLINIMRIGEVGLLEYTHCFTVAPNCS